MKSALSLCWLGCVAGLIPLQAEDFPIGQGIRLPAAPRLLPPGAKAPGGVNPIVEDTFEPGDVDGTEIIKPAIPKMLWLGRGLPYPNPDFPNLEPGTSKDVYRITATVPVGVRLLSTGCPVTSSDPAVPAETLSLITDGDRHGDDGYYVELAKGRQWVQIDLGASRRLHLIWLWRFHKMQVCFPDTVIQVSDDPECKTSVTVYNSDHDNSSNLGSGKDFDYYESHNGRAVSFAPVSGRYVRLWSREAAVLDANCYIEMSIYGEPTDK